MLCPPIPSSSSSSSVPFSSIPSLQLKQSARLRAITAMELRSSARRRLSTKSEPIESFPFLELPASTTVKTRLTARAKYRAKLRNSIYEHCVEPPNLRPKYKGQKCTFYDRIGSGLSQVCRQLRTEFRPIYLGSTIHV